MPVAVRPAAPLHRQVELVRASAGTTVDLSPADGLLPEGATTSVVVSALPAVELRPALEQLVDYPYGCVEQTVSSAFPQLYLGRLLELSTLSARNQAARHHVTRAARRRGRRRGV